MYAFSKFKNNEIISAKSLVLAFLFVRFFWGGEEGLQKITFCTVVKMMRKSERPPTSSYIINHINGVCKSVKTKINVIENY